MEVYFNSIVQLHIKKFQQEIAQEKKKGTG